MHIYIYIHTLFIHEQGSPDQMVPPPLWPGGGSQQQQAYMGSVCAALGG